MKNISINDFLTYKGKNIGTSRWFTINQTRINSFADNTEDHQFIHIDLPKAKKTNFGSTIAHGFLTLSMLSTMSYNAIPSIAGVKMSVNYGFNKIRFVSPVKSGARIRSHFTLINANSSIPNELTNTWKVEIEIKGENRPALVAEWISRLYL